MLAGVLIYSANLLVSIVVGSVTVSEDNLP
jgi:hypothetical protein